MDKSNSLPFYEIDNHPKEGSNQNPIYDLPEHRSSTLDLKSNWLKQIH